MLNMPDSPLKIRPMPASRAGDLQFAVFFLAISILLISQLGAQTTWVGGTKFFAQPRFWPAISLIGMTCFALLYFLKSAFSKRADNSLAEILVWVKSVEYALWFMAYVFIVPLLGYLLSSIVFVVTLAFRSGYREKNVMIMSVAVAVMIVVIFKGFLSVKIPGGQMYELLPDAIRNVMILYL